MAGKELDPVTFEILRHRGEEILAEMYYAIVRVTGNPVLYEAGDHEEAILDAQGETVLAGGGVVEWTTCLEGGGKYLVETFDKDPGFREGEQWLHNHPYNAAVHAMDVQVLAPVFWEGKRVAWVVTAGHQSDVGGIDPGSMCGRAEEVFQEGLLVRGLRIVEEGRVRKEVEETIRGLVRTPDSTMLGLYGEIAANNVAIARLHDTIRRYGVDTILAFFEQIKRYSEEKVRRRLREIPDGQWHVEHYFESLRPEEGYLKVAVTAIKEGDELTLDFTGSSPQSAGSQNIGLIGAMSNAHCSYLSLLCHDIPWSAGAWRPLKFELPEGTVVNPRWPAPTSFNTPAGAGYAVIGSVHDAISRMLLTSEQNRQEAFAMTDASGHWELLHGPDHDGNFFSIIVMDGICGGMGALAHRDGDDSWGNMWGPKTQICNVETHEFHYPLLFLMRKETIDGGGPGKFRGGTGFILAFMLWDNAGEKLGINDLGIGSESRMGIGLAGGYPAPNVQWGVVRNSNALQWMRAGRIPRDLTEVGEVEILQPSARIMLDKNDVCLSYTSGGGGYGDPIDRDPALVLRDVTLGYASLEAAKDWYGVVVDPKTLMIDLEKTKEQRQKIAKERLRVGRK